MSEKVGSTYWDLDLDDKKFNKGVDAASAKADGLAGRFKAAEKGSKYLLGALAGVGAGAVAMGVKMVKSTGELETMRAGFVGILGSAEKADKAIKMIKKDAAATPFELPGLIRANQLLTAVTKDAGRSEKILLNVGKALATVGGGQEELDRIIVNLQQIGAVGKASMLDIKQFAFAGIPIFEMLQEHTGLAGEELETFIKEGRVTFDELEGMFIKAGTGSGRFAKAFSSAAGTFEQLFSNMKDSILIFGTEFVTQIGLFDAAKKVIGLITDKLGELQDSIDEAGGVVNWLNGIFEKNKILIHVLAGAIIGALVPSFYALATSIWSSLAPLIPFLAVGAAVGLLVYKLVDIFGGWKVVTDKLKKVFTGLKQIVEGVVLGFQDWDWINDNLFEGLKKLGIPADKVRIITGKLQVVMDKFKTVASGIRQTIDGVVLGLQDWDWINDNLFEGLQKLGIPVEKVRIILQKLQPIMDNIRDTFTRVKDGIIDFIKTAVTKIQEFVTSAPVQRFLQILGTIIYNIIQNLKRTIIGLWPKLVELGNKFKELWIKIQPLLKILGTIAAVFVGVVIISIYKFIEFVTSLLLPVLSTVIDILGFVVDAIGNFVEYMSTKVIPAVVPVIQKIGARIMWLWTTIIKPVITLIIGLFKVGFTIVKFLWETILRPVLKVIGNVIKLLFKNIAFFWENILKPVFMLIFAVVAAVFKKISDTITRRINKIKTFLSLAVVLIKHFIINPFMSAWKKIKGYLELAWGFIKMIFNKIVDFFKKKTSAITDGITKPFKLAKEKIEKLGSDIKKAANKVNPFHKESPSLVEWVAKGTENITKLYDRMFQNINAMASAPNLALAGGVGMADSIFRAEPEKPLSQNVTNVTISPKGIVARSRGELRDITKDMLEAVNEELRSKGVTEIGEGKISGSITNK